jgi:glycosyl transferase family 25
VISLARAEERRRNVVEQFGALGLPYELVDAVDGTMLDPETRARSSQHRALFEVGRPLTDGEVGCSLSHLRVYERMVAERVPEVLVVEDDVRPTAALADVLAARDALPPDWQVVTLHSLFATADPQPVPGPPLADGYRVCRYRRIPFGTQCTLVSLSAARRLVDVGYPVRMPADELLYRRRPAGLRVYGIEPSPVVHEELGTQLRVGPRDAGSGLGRAVDRAVVTAGRVRTRIVRPSRMLP